MRRAGEVVGGGRRDTHIRGGEGVSRGGGSQSVEGGATRPAFVGMLSGWMRGVEDDVLLGGINW